MKSLPRPRAKEEDIELERLESEKEDAQNRLQTASMTRDWTQGPKPSKDGLLELIIESGALDKAIAIYFSVDEDSMALFGINEKQVEHVDFNSTANTCWIQKLVIICLHEFKVSESRASWMDAVEPLVLLSTAILEPLEETITAVEHIIFISSGDLTRFPFGTLIFESAHLIMQKAVSQAPSLYGLLYLIT